MGFLPEDPRLRAIHETLKGARAPRPRTVILDPRAMRTLRPWVSEVIRRAGGIDCLAPDETGYSASEAIGRAVTMDDVRATDPEVIVFAPGGDLAAAEEETQRQLTRPEWAWASTRHCLVLDADTLLRHPGPQLIDAVTCLAPFMAPALFPPAPAHLARALSR